MDSTYFDSISIERLLLESTCFDFYCTSSNYICYSYYIIYSRGTSNNLHNLTLIFEKQSSKRSSSAPRQNHPFIASFLNSTKEIQTSAPSENSAG